MSVPGTKMVQIAGAWNERPRKPRTFAAVTSHNPHDPPCMH